MTFKAALRAGLAFACPLFISPVYAQAREGGWQAAKRPDPSEIVITGTAWDDGYAPEQATGAGKTPQDILKTPSSVSVITREQIEDRNFFTIGDALQQVAGVTVMPYDGLNPDYRARGYVLDYAYDGIPSTFSSGVQEFDLVVYERIEVQRGPTGLFRGSGSPGGTINFVRKRGLEEFAVSGALSAGSWDNYRGELDIGGPVDAAGRLRTRSVISYQDQGFFADKSHLEKLVAYAAVDFDLTPTTMIAGSVTYQDSDAQASYNGQPAFLNGEFLDFPRDFNHLPSWNTANDSTIEYAGEIAQKVGSWTLRLRGLQRDFDKYFRDAFASSGVDPETLTARYNRRRAEGVDNRTGVDAFATGPFSLFGREHELLFGYSYVRRYGTTYSVYGSSVEDVSILDPEAVPPVTEPYTLGYEDIVTQSGFHGQVRLRPLDALTIVAGARLSDYTAKGRYMPPSTPTPLTTSRDVSGKFVPSVGAVLEVVPNVTVYGSYSDIFIPQTARTSDGNVLEPRIGKQVEGGVKGRFFDGQLNASAAVFRTREVNRALRDSDAPGFFLPSGEVKIEGFEFEVSGSPLPGLDVTAGYTNLKTGYEVSDLPPGAIFSIFEPRHLYKAYVRYEPPALHGAFASLGLNGQSSVIGTGKEGVREQGPFAIVNAQAGYRLNENVRAFGTVNNLFDKTYYSRVGSLNTYNFYGEPRNVLLTLRANY